MNLPENAIDIYESFRKQLFEEQTYPQGVSMIIYHGILRGLHILTTQSNQSLLIKNPHENFQQSTQLNPGLIRLLANMVLCSQSEVMHVY